ncbi:PREDICTED: putative disease resistance protein At4g10780 [Theobroma cacao]|uniref:Disease resistance protein At4g10780 n=1 Tax=Theobroma cacao TaxID=3641 RepID=A0AB32WLC0_THECC|nr:PREDICTED: putative disease resistance protein At4g10780 [Theobroma cacao]
MELLGSILEAVKFLVAPICTYIDHCKKLEERMTDLKRELEDLNCRKRDIESTVEAQMGWQKEVKKEVEKWLEDVQRINDEIQMLEQKVQAVSCFSRLQLSKLVCQKLEETKKLCQCNFPEVLVIDKPSPAGVTLGTTALKGETTAKKEILNYLMDDKVGMIGVCGMGGIGKTTIMKHINNQLLEESKFDKVIWITVSRELNIVKLQKNIADAMKENLPELEDQVKWAAALTDILGKKKFVLILDDVWNWFSLVEVGIPEPTRNGSKLVLTSRSIDLFMNMGCKVVKVQPLSKEDSLNLFLDNSERSVLQDPPLEEIASHVVDECAGLPLAIVTIARSMKGVSDIREWRNALEELRKCVKSVKGTDIEVFERLKFSYDHLQDSKIQNCFLYCSLYPEDWKISRKELIEYWIDEGFIDELGTRQAMHDRGHTILNKLENNCLLERVDDGNSVKIHDVLRDMALYIKSKNGTRFMVKAGMQLRELPGQHEWEERLEKVSLMCNSISEISPDISPKCQRLSTLLLKRNDFSMRIPESFFENMHELKVLDLSYTNVEYLPNTISNLENLTSLILVGCKKLRYVPSLAKLRALKKLDLHFTSIEEIPDGMEMLVNLRYLDLFSSRLKEIPIGILPRLSRLQFLVVSWQSRTLKIKGEEAAALMKLETFVGRFHELQDFNTYIKSIQGERPTSYKLFVGSQEKDLWSESFVKDVILCGCKIGGEDQILLPNDLRCIRISKCHDVRSLNEISFFRKATQLRVCDLIDCKGIECVLDLSVIPSSSSSLQNLENLLLSELDRLSMLVKAEAAALPTSVAPPGIFTHLKSLCIYKCPDMKKLFPFKLLQDLQNLEEIEVRSCGQMKEIIASEEERDSMGEGKDHTTTSFNFPKLRELELCDLPELKSICSTSRQMVCDSLEGIKVTKCPKLKRIPLYLVPDLVNGQLSPPLSLQRIEINSEEWDELELDHPNAKTILRPFLQY